MGTLTFGKQVEICYNTDTFGFSAKKDGVIFHTAENFVPYLLLKGGSKLPLSAAKV